MNYIDCTQCFENHEYLMRFILSHSDVARNECSLFWGGANIKWQSHKPPRGGAMLTLETFGILELGNAISRPLMSF